MLTKKHYFEDTECATCKVRETHQKFESHSSGDFFVNALQLQIKEKNATPRVGVQSEKSPVFKNC